MSEVKMTDIRSLKFCSNGARNFFKKHGMDWSEFIKNGLPESEFLRTGDHMAMQAVEQSRKRRFRNG